MKLTNQSGLLSIALLLIGGTSNVFAHSPSSKPLSLSSIDYDPHSPLSWQSQHMQSEHGLESYDPESFFQLHLSSDSSTKGYDAWTAKDILNIYGLTRDKIVGSGDGMGRHEEHDHEHGDDKDHETIDEATKERVVNAVLDLCDFNGDKMISLDEFLRFSNGESPSEMGVGLKELPDMGVGIGHHGDYEYEYELHHWIEFHKDNDPDVKIVHQEDIEHDLLYHAHEGENEPYKTIPDKFRYKN